MLFDLTVPCYLTTLSGKKCLSGKVICAFICPAYRNSPVPHIPLFNSGHQALPDKLRIHSMHLWVGDWWGLGGAPDPIWQQGKEYTWH
jgi:hypothetical protein